MILSEFVQFTKSLDSDNLQLPDLFILHAVLGIGGEAGELIDLIKKSAAYHQPLNMEKLKEETGDLLHYLARLIESCGWTFEEVIEANVSKLQKRYPNGFNYEDAIIRRDKEEEK